MTGILAGARALPVCVAMLLAVLLLAAPDPARAHTLRPAIAEIAIAPDRVELTIVLPAEALLAGIDMAAVDDSNDAPQAGRYDRLRAMPPGELEQAFRAAWPRFAAGLTLLAGETDLVPALEAVRVAPIADIALPRDTTVTLSAALPPDDSPVRFGWDASYGALVLRQIADGTGDSDASAGAAYSAYLAPGGLGAALPRNGIVRRSALAAFVAYIGVGFIHIVPKGLDHILFVLGLFFFSLKLRPLLAQVTAFTLAHTVTLALATLGWISLPASIVEPLIAASIVYVAVENIGHRRLTRWRILVVFGFGLLHGLGFAAVLDQVGLSPGRLIGGLVGFNIGVELGQLAVIATAWLLVGYWFGARVWYRERIAVPVSVAIGVMGAWWLIERTIL